VSASIFLVWQLVPLGCRKGRERRWADLDGCIVSGEPTAEEIATGPLQTSSKVSNPRDLKKPVVLLHLARNPMFRHLGEVVAEVQRLRLLACR
jgi:hypothetical protein